MTTNDTTVREWVDQQVRRVTGLDLRRFGAASETEQARLVERFGAQFSVDVDEETGSSTVEFSGSRGLARSPAEAAFSAPAAALRNRAALLLPDAIDRLKRLRPVSHPTDTEAVESTTRVVDTTLRQLQGAFRADEFVDEIDLYFNQLLEEDDYAQEGQLGRLGALLGLADPAAVTSLDDDRSLAEYLTVLGHVKCLHAGWKAIEDGRSFGSIALQVAERAECIERRSDELSAVLGDDACVQVPIERVQVAIEGRVRTVDLRTINAGLRQQAGVWRRAALANRADLLAQKAYVDLYNTKLNEVLDSRVLEELLEGDQLDRARGIIRELEKFTNRISIHIESLQEPTGTVHVVEEG